MQKTEWIYESPDKGATVYRRRANSSYKELVSRKPGKHPLVESMSKIVEESHTDPVLQDMLEKLQIYWSLRNASN